MPTDVNDIIKKLSPAQRKKVKSRAAELMAEDKSLRELGKPAEVDAPELRDRTRH